MIPLSDFYFFIPNSTMYMSDITPFQGIILSSPSSFMPVFRLSILFWVWWGWVVVFLGPVESGAEVYWFLDLI